MLSRVKQGDKRPSQRDAISTANGVCSGGIRYSPLTESQKQALAFGESDDGMSSDE